MGWLLSYLHSSLLLSLPLPLSIFPSLVLSLRAQDRRWRGRRRSGEVTWACCSRRCPQGSASRGWATEPQAGKTSHRSTQIRQSTLDSNNTENRTQSERFVFCFFFSTQTPHLQYCVLYKGNSKDTIHLLNIQGKTSL